MAKDDYTLDQIERISAHESPEQMIFTKLDDLKTIIIQFNGTRVH